MMKKVTTVVCYAVLGLCVLTHQAWAGDHRLGFGANYWVALDDIDVDDVDDDGFSYIPSYQYWFTDYVGVELDVEILPDYYDETAYAPEAYFLIGKALYAGVGIGIMSYDGDFADEPFFALRAGVNLEVLPNTFLDISANYRFNNETELSEDDTDIDSDTVFLGAAVRFSL